MNALAPLKNKEETMMKKREGIITMEPDDDNDDKEETKILIPTIHYRNYSTCVFSSSLHDDEKTQSYRNKQTKLLS
jgi:hypothetical protein